MAECKSGKVGYASAKAAKLTAVQIINRSRHHKPMAWGGAGALGAYRCPLCGQFHVGHQSKARTRRPKLHLIDEDDA